MTTSWVLFVDESGNFSDASDVVAVGGLLLRDSPALQPHVLKASLQRAVPELPWPFHAAFVNQPAYVALAASVKPTPENNTLRSAIERARGLLEDEDRPRTKAVRKSLESGIEPE